MITEVALVVTSCPTNGWAILTLGLTGVVCSEDTC